MSTLTLTPLKKERFALIPALELRTLSVRFTGTGDMSASATIALFLSLVHREAQRLGVREVVFDLRELAFLNSSCLKSFVSWIDNVASLEATARYKIRFLSSPRHPWQRRSLDALRSLAEDIVTIER